MPHLSAVLFDFGKVLTLQPNPAVWIQLKTISGLSEGDLQRDYWRLRDDYDSGHLDGDAYWTAIGQAGGKSFTQQTLADLKAADVRLWTEMNTPMLAWVDTLHQAGVRTGILSNMPDAMADGIEAQFAWLTRFHHITWSYKLKLRKPQPEIYAVAVAGLGVPAHEILFVDDIAANIAAARAAGMHALLYARHAEFVSEFCAAAFSGVPLPVVAL